MTDQPRQPPYHSEADAIALPAEHDWSAQELWAWARILRGETANLSDFDPKLDRAKDFSAWLEGKDDGAGWDANAETEGVLAPWPAHRGLSATFLRLILFHPTYANARARPWVRILAAEFSEPLQWANETFEGELWLDKCRFKSDVDWRGLRLSGLLSLEGSRFEEDLGADRLAVEGALLCSSGFVAMRDVRFPAARVVGQATFNGATLHGSLNADSLSVEGSLFCGDGFVAKGEVRLVGATIDLQVSLSGATLEGGLVADGLAVKNDLLVNDVVVSGEVRLVGARVGGLTSFIGSTLGGMVTADNLSVEGGLFLRQMKRLGDADFVSLRAGGNVQLSDSTIEGELDFTGAQLEGELQTSQHEGSIPVWGEQARLILRNATIGALAGGVGSFPKTKKSLPAPMELTGLTYARLGGVGASKNKAGSLSDATSRQLIAWLEAGHNRNEFTPGPYRQLASALATAGHPVKANRILHAMRKHERRCERNLMRKLALFFSGTTIGFGYRNDYAVYWFAVIVFGFAALGLYLNGVRELDFSPTGLSELARWVGFSFGNSIPLIQLDKAHETFLAVQFVDGATGDPERYVHQVPTAIAWAFYGQKVLGFAILSFLAAGLTGTATRQRE